VCVDPVLVSVLVRCPSMNHIVPEKTQVAAIQWNQLEVFEVVVVLPDGEDAAIMRAEEHGPAAVVDVVRQRQGTEPNQET